MAYYWLVILNIFFETSHTKTTNLVIENECESLDASSAIRTKCKGNINIADKKLVSPTKSINLIEMREDYWLEDKGWMCQTCEKVFKLEIAFKNHLRRTELCNLSYKCGNCNADFKLDELKLHILKKPQCRCQTAIYRVTLQRHLPRHNWVHIDTRTNEVY